MSNGTTSHEVDELNLMGMEMIYRLMPTFLSGRVRELKPSTPIEAAGLADTHLHNRGQSGASATGASVVSTGGGTNNFPAADIALSSLADASWSVFT